MSLWNRGDNHIELSRDENISRGKNHVEWTLTNNKEGGLVLEPVSETGNPAKKRKH